MSTARKKKTTVTKSELPESVRRDIKAFRRALSTTPPVTSGTVSIPSDHCVLYYDDKEGHAKKLNVSKASADELAHLMNACEPATFGRNDEDILDEEYRKAGKLELGSFSANLQFTELRTILDKIQNTLAEGADNAVEAELYKLNTYGVGGFFKAHKDTPRSDDLLGSLVIVLPTAHEGGEFVLRHEEESWTFDFGSLSSMSSEGNSSSSIGYIAFYSDIEHEVMPVTSGCRITLTYNLKWTSKSSSAASQSDALTTVDPKTQRLNDTLVNLLKNPLILPQGGRLGFHLRHQYPLQRETSKKWGPSISTILPLLKGSDRALYQACLNAFPPSDEEDTEGPAVTIKLYCQLYCGDFLCDNIVDLAGDSYMEEPEILERLKKRGGNVILASGKGSYVEHLAEDMEKWKVTWLNGEKKEGRMTETFVSYGNESELRHAYYDACLVVKLGTKEERMGEGVGDV